ncbi:sulfotransferase domain-containing protein [Micromonospora sp. NBC_01813]|uniref:sulfotransferase domain-containing protein n=1 Tax=Micromonospora sp. NBC_01813 TaxID=2975988 RepID=UPI002DDC3F39|nr:sulfotransferase domain-containing protein [Micromonospora sp. NBC_01813]WSA08327.1 sulfotransferase [Micromonospora sp. NBC_01813]
MPLRSRIPQPLRQLRRIAHARTWSYSQLTAPGRVLPSFLICGGHRCGTAGLHRMLAAHPLVLRAARRDGVSFFDVSYERGIDWYRGHFPRQRTARRLQRRHGGTASAFETSPYYLYHPYAAVRIARDLPDVRLLVLVRDPAARAWSHFRVERAAGHEPEPSFARALALESARLRGQEERLGVDAGYRSFAHQHHAYRQRGEYADYLDRLAGQVGRGRIHVVEAERLWATPTEVYAEVLEFLGLPLLDTTPPTPLDLPGGFAPTGFAPAGVPVGFAPVEPLGARTRRELSDHFVPHDAQLARWLGRPPVWRTTTPEKETP